MSDNIIFGIEMGKYTSWMGYSNKKDSKRIFSIPLVDDSQIVSTKTTTSLLLNEDRSFNAFGADADSKYATLDNKTKRKSFYFQHFELPQAGHREDIHVTDRHGKKLERLFIFSTCLKYFIQKAEHLLSIPGMHRLSMQISTFVLIIPDGLPDFAWRFVTDTACQAGIRENCLHIVTESEAIATYYALEGSPSTSRMEPDELYIVSHFKDGMSSLSINTHIGGGVADQVKLKEDLVGLDSVWVAFESLMKEIVQDQWEDIRKDEIYTDVRSQFTDRTLKFKGDKDVLIRMPLPDMIDESRIQQYNRKKFGVEFKTTGLFLPSDLFESLFFELKTSVKANLGFLIQRFTINNKSSLFLSGDVPFLIVRLLKHAFPSMHICQPEEPETICLKGAIYHCHNRANGHSKAKLFSAAIDIGTAFSGYAYSSKADKTKVNVPIWKNLSGGVPTHKAPTALLLDNSKSFVAFGYKAIEEFSSKAETEDHIDNYFFFHRFKMVLYGQKITRKMMLSDETGKTMEAMTVFSIVIEHLKKMMMDEINRSLNNVIFVHDIQFVITIPAIWSDYAKSFIHEAANRAGIPSENLLLALEPEAASISCLLEYDTTTDDDQRRKAIRPGQNFLVVDIGGGTTDIMAHLRLSSTQSSIRSAEVSQHMTGLSLKGNKTQILYSRSNEFCLEEIMPATGGALGGCDVDKAIISFIGEMLGRNVMDIVKREHKDDYLFILQNIDIAKRSVEPEKSMWLKVPYSLLEVIRKDTSEGDMKKTIAKSKFSNTVEYRSSKLKIFSEKLQDFFEETNKGIIRIIQQIMEENEDQFDAIVLVGGMAESKVLIDAMSRHFPTQRIIVPQGAEQSVLKGAVYFGHNPATVLKRVTRYTYYLENQSGGLEALITKGTQVRQGEVRNWQDTINVTASRYDAHEINVFGSSDNGSIDCVGTLRIPLYNVRPGTSIDVQGCIQFGLTEIKIQATYTLSGIIHKVISEIFD